MDQREKQRLLWNLRSLPNELEDLVNDLDEATLRWRPIPDKWSMIELLCHLRDMEHMAYQDRYRRMLAEDNPLLPNVDQDRVATQGNYLQQNTRAVLGEFKQLRAETVRILQAAPPEDWSRSGVHEVAGPVTIEQLVNQQINHDLNHLVQMKDIARLKMPW
jgi:hypothetical protein